MSFMFNPNAYDEPTAVNRPVLPDGTAEQLVTGILAVSEKLTRAASPGTILAFDGYPSAEFEPIVNLCAGALRLRGREVAVVAASDAYYAPETLDKMLASYLPTDREKDPVLLFGRRFEAGYAGIFDPDLYTALLNRLDRLKAEGKTVIFYGFGAAHTEALRTRSDTLVYLDVIPKEAVLRAKNGRMRNIGDKIAKPFKELMRRAYYVDFEMALSLRRTLMQERLFDYYVDSTDVYKMLPKDAFLQVLSALSSMPFRCAPVYLEGVWGGQYVKQLRNVPDSAMKNIAWVFDFIPMEVSIKAAIGNNTINIPFYSFLHSRGEDIMGKSCVEKFDGFFPIRFNYDDTYHSSGNMSIQVHSGAEYNRENYGEFGRQDESYYIIEAGHGAKTYLGFCDDADPNAFLEEAKRSEKHHTEIDYARYIHAVESKPGVQVMIPAGTVHASGQNQLILEIGSLTIGSYTYKLYDYLRLDLDGVPRPIHTYHGERALRKERNATWIKENVVQVPRVVREGRGWRETIIGEHDLLYFSLRHLEFNEEIEDDTNGRFHVLSLVNGRSVLVESVSDPTRCYKQNYLDIIVVPASIGRYRIRNLSTCPVIIHKTMLKDGFEND